MSTAVIQTAFVSGELSPSVFGRVDLDRYHIGASTMRNAFVSYRGGAYSRAGTMFVGYSKQTGRAYPPRLIPFQFSIQQGLSLEFGHQYMRVISNGAYVTESPVDITGITKANPAVVTAPATGLSTVSANTGAVTSSYAPGDTVTLAGGSYAIPAVVNILTTKLVGLSAQTPGSGYVPADTVTLSGGAGSTAAVITVSTTQVSSAAIHAAGSGGTDGPATVTGTTGTGTKFQAQVTISGGAIVSIDSISAPGSYTVNPTLSGEAVTGGGLTGATLDLTMGVNTLSITTAGAFTANPNGGIFTQLSTSGSGVGATFDLAIMAPLTESIADPGSYTTFPTSPVSQLSTSGTGAGVTFTCTSGGTPPFADGDWAYLTGIGGMTELNGETFVLKKLTDSTYSLYDVFGNPVDSSAFGSYTSGGTISRIYTLTTQYSEEDLRWIKYTQSADEMTLTCVNQTTGVEYAALDLKRIEDDDWTQTPITSNSTVDAPASASATITSTGTTYYQYVVTAVNPDDGTESIASPVASVEGVEIATTAGSVSIIWSAVAKVNQYNIYKAQPGYKNPIPAGSLFGFAGSAYGTQFIDANITPDFSQVPPRHEDPFARGQVVGADVQASGSGYTTSCTLTINTSTGSGAVLTPVVQSGKLVAIIVEDAGAGYADGDTITVGGNGTGATATLDVGPQTGTYPAVCSYFQERRVFGFTLNNPDTYFMSQAGAFTNFDKRIPTIDTDSIIGTPWSVQVNGIQFMVNMPGGLVILTGLSAWQLVGSGTFATNVQPITPSNQDAQPEAYNGCSPTIPPIKIDYDIIYVQAKGSIYRSLSYQFYVNVYTGIDITESSSHLFLGYTILDHAWAEEPYKVLWSVRDDGVLLSLTFNKPQQVAAWARHDTFGLYQSVCSITEPPVDALYLAVQRVIDGNISYMVERMDDRIWSGVESTWCVDAGLRLPQPSPAAALTASSATGLGAISGVTNLVGGTGYSAATTASVVDDDGNGPGSGAVPVLTITAGVITAITFNDEGSGYVSPALIITDPSNAGSGASADLTLDNSATFTASAATFAAGDVGSVIRMGGGIAVITSYTDSTHVTANIISPIITVFNDVPDDGAPLPQPAAGGNWTKTKPVTKISGLRHLIGATVTGLADGIVVPPTLVDDTGSVTLGTAASAVTLGLGFQAQLQSVYLDTGEPTIQGQRKKISAATVRVENSRGIKVGANQVDGSTLSPIQVAPAWQDMQSVPDLFPPPYGSAVAPLYTGDVRVPLEGGWEKPGQVCVQQDYPLPMQVLAFMPEVLMGNTSEQKATPRQRQPQQAPQQ